MSLCSRLICLTALPLAWLLSQTSVTACVICIDYPRQSSADVLIDSPCVVFARESTDRPFTYAIVEVLHGDPPEPPVDLLVDSHTRRLLKADPSRFVVLAIDPETSKWRKLGMTDDAYERIVRRIVLLGAEWRKPGGDRKRVEFFTSLFGHPNPIVYQMAYLEIARAPYPVIKRLSGMVSRDKITPMLERRQYLTWRSLAILMLAHQANASDRERIREAVEDAAKFQLTTNLSAWIAASIEIDGRVAIHFLDEQYLSGAHRTDDEIRAVLQALSVHGREGRTDLRNEIVTCYGKVLQSRPDLAAMIIPDLIAWDRSDLAGQLALIRASDESLSPEASAAIGRYIAMTGEQSSHTSAVGRNPAETESETATAVKNRAKIGRPRIRDESEIGATDNGSVEIDCPPE